MLPGYLQWPCHTYLALGGDKGTKLRIRLTRNGIIPDLWSGISRPRGGEDILGPPLAGFSLRSGGGLVAEDTVEVRLCARRYELTDWLGSVRVGVTDQHIPIYNKGKKLVGYRAEVVEVRDYY